MLNFQTGNSVQIEKILSKRLEKIRLARNITQAQLAQEAGVSLRTIARMESGRGVSLDTFIRVLQALGLEDNLNALLPDPVVRPIERVHTGGKERQRARPAKPKSEKPWVWGDERKP